MNEKKVNEVDLARYQILELSREEVLSLASTYLAGEINLPNDTVCLEAREDFLTGNFQFKLCSKSFKKVNMGIRGPIMERQDRSHLTG